jgi:hypothetical protein
MTVVGQKMTGNVYFEAENLKAEKTLEIQNKLNVLEN